MLSVLKFGGASLARPEQILDIAKKIRERHLAGEKLIVVVSAMGKTTDELMGLAHRVSSNPNRRELDMLLTTGERVSMALMSMALHDLNVPSISLTGSQAGVLTDGSFSNAKVIDIRPMRVETSLKENRVVIIAGFQGVEPNTKEITTLGRGGSDTTAVALAAHFQADRCEILKDVDGVFTADPRIVPEARRLEEVSARTMLEMCFWGAKVLHYRSVRLASRRAVPLFVGRSNSFTIGTNVIHVEKSMYEQYEMIGINSHSEVQAVEISSNDSHEGLNTFKNLLSDAGLPWPQILNTDHKNGRIQILFTADADTLNGIRTAASNNANVRFGEKMASVTATCFGAVGTDLPQTLVAILHGAGIRVHGFVISPLSVTFFIPQDQRESAIRFLHSSTAKKELPR